MYSKSAQPKSNRQVECDKCDNQRCPVRLHIAKPKLAKIALKKTTLHFKKEQQIIFEGSSVIGIYFIYSGKVKVFKRASLDAERVLRFSGPGDMLGHRGYGEVLHYPISATSIEDCTLCFFSTADFFEMAKKNADFTFHLMMAYAAELRIAEQRLFQHSEHTAKDRLLGVIDILEHQFGKTSHNRIDLPLNRKDLASLAGITYETTIRILSELKNSGVLAFKDRYLQKF